MWLERRLATDEDLDPHLITFRFSVSPRDAVQLAGGGRQLEELGEFALRHKCQETTQRHLFQNQITRSHLHGGICPCIF